MSVSGTYAPTTTDHKETSTSNQDRHDQTTNESNHYEHQHHSTNSGNVTKSTEIADASDRSTNSTTNTSAQSISIVNNIHNSQVQMPSTGSSVTSIPQPGQSIPKEKSLQDNVSNADGLCPEILDIVMSDDKKILATNIISLAFLESKNCKKRAELICEKLEDQFKTKSWNYVLGSNLQANTKHRVDCFIHLELGNQELIVFRTPEITAESEIEQLKESLHFEKLSMKALHECRHLLDEYRSDMDKLCAIPRSVPRLSKRHEEKQKDKIQKFIAWQEVNIKNENIQEEYKKFITEETCKIFAAYNATNEKKRTFENEPGQKRYNGKDNVDLVLKLNDGNVIQTKAVFSAMMRTDRGNFMISPNYNDDPQEIHGHTTISAPHMHARTLELISDKLKEGAKVLDIGFGSGYLTTCMAHMIGERGIVVGIDINPKMKEVATKYISVQHKDLLDKGRITLLEGNGRNGHLAHSPYDAIHLGVATEKIPPKLLDQLKPGGRIIAPLGPRSRQRFTQVDKDENGEITHTETFAVSYAPLE